MSNEHNWASLIQAVNRCADAFEALGEIAQEQNRKLNTICDALTEEESPLADISTAILNRPIAHDKDAFFSHPASILDELIEQAEAAEDERIPTARELIDGKGGHIITLDEEIERRQDESE